MALLRTRLIPPGQMQLNRRVLLLGAVGVVLLVALLAVAQRSIPSVGTLFAKKEPEPMRKVDLPEVLKEPARPYADLIPKPQPPTAQPVVQPVMAQAQGPTPPAPPVTPPVQPPAATTPPPSFVDLWQRQQDAVAQTAQQQAGSPPPKHQAQKPQRESWIIRPTDITIKENGTHGSKGDKDSKETKETLGREGNASQLIKPAVWARPKDGTKVLYASQLLPCMTETAIDSSLPGRVIARLTAPVMDKVTRTKELLPKDALVVAAQETQQVKYGQYRLALSIKQFEFPDGAIWAVKSTMADGEGKQGLTGDVDNHWLRLGAAALINGVLGIGVNSLAGTPGQGYYYQNPAQQAAKDMSQSITEDVRSITKEQLKVPPTITIPAKTACTIYLEDNISFARKATVIR